MVYKQTTKQILLLNTIHTTLNQNNLLLYTQPIHNKKNKNYNKILTQLKYNNNIITPNKFLPLITQFNLNTHFNLQILKSLLK